MATNEGTPIIERPQAQDNKGSENQHGPSGEHTLLRTVGGQEQNNDLSDSKQTKQFLLWIKGLFGFVFCVLILCCTVFSKLTLVSLTDSLRAVTYCNGSNSPKNEISLACNHSQAVTLYWQLLLIIVIPNVIGFIRSLAFGVLGKTTSNFPWPTVSGAIIGGIASVLEVMAISVFVFLVLAELPPGISILLLSGVFFCQFVVDIWYTEEHCCNPRSCRSNISLACKSLRRAKVCRNNYLSIEDNDDQDTAREKKKSWRELIENFFRGLLETKFVKLVSLVLQITSLLAFIFVWCFYSMTEDKVHLQYLYRLRPMIALPICLLVLSFIWTNKFQDWIARAKEINGRKRQKTARYKSSFINSSIRLFLYPFVTYIVFRFATSHQIDPWCLPGSCDNFGINFSGDTLWIFLVQVFTTFFAYIFAWITCTMTIGRFSMGAAFFVSTPIAAASYYLHTFAVEESALFFPYFDYTSMFITAYPVVPPLLLCLWFSQLLGMVFYISTKKNSILSKDSDMFLVPYYDGIFFEQHMILNRQTRKYIYPTKCGKNLNDPPSQSKPQRSTDPRMPKTVFICSTMYRESSEEMKQMLTSIGRVAKHYEQEKQNDPDNCDTFESHIFFDRALNGIQLQKFGLQLLALLGETLKVKPLACRKIKAPYGMCLHYTSLGMNEMPFYIHFKDPNLVKPGKRWSQVMYMNYVIYHRIKNDPRLTADNTFILTTDADIDFTAKSAVVLLDMLESNPMVGAVCARTHPKGSGPLYWYQVFDYAIGHWFQKPAEHLLGCVLCSPGCFSVFRCSALKKVIETYSSQATTGREFLMKDMGEDRWLSTLLIEKGCRLEYCAISENETYCPQSFADFFVQRKRWIPSTIANLIWLISGICRIPRNNDSVSVLFILFQTIILLSTALSPATVILVIASGLQSQFKLSNGVVFLIIAIFVIISVLYGAVCLFTSPKTQIDVAKVLSFVFALIMLVVLAGIAQDVIKSIIRGPELTFLEATNCTLFNGPNHTKALEDCIKSARYLNSLPDSVIGEQFKLPVSTIVIYFGLFVVIYLLAAILHFREFPIIFLLFLYFLALPSGYVLLLIYSAANLDSQKWGTRESGGGKDEGLLGCGKHFKKAWKKLVSCCVRTRCCKPDEVMVKLESEAAEDKRPLLVEISRRRLITVQTEHRLDEEARKWLKEQECEEYFEKHGYTTKHYIAEMKMEDFEAIGIDMLGFRHRLAKAAKTIPSLSINVEVPKDIGKWLDKLEMGEYKENFKRAGFSKKEDVEHLKFLTKEELKVMGITKRAHLNRMLNAIHFVAYPSKLDQEMSQINQKLAEEKFREFNEAKARKFWHNLVVSTLEPVPEQLTSVDELKKSLRSLRNHSLVALFLINIMWIIILFSIKIPRLSDYGFNPQAFQLLFLVVYGFILIIQFIALVCHRGITLVHFFGRITPKEADARSTEEFEEVEHVGTTLTSVL